MTDAEIDAFLAEGDSSDEELDAFLDADEPEGDASLAGATANVQTSTFGFADEIQAAVETVPYAVGEAVSGRGVEIEDLADYYRYRRDSYRKEAAELAESNPTATLVGTGVGIASQLAAPALGGATLGRALLSGAAYGGTAALGASEAEDIGGIAGDVAEGAVTGAAVGGAARGLLSVASGRLAARTARAQEKSATAVAAERDSALRLAGLEGKQRTLGGARRAKERGQTLYDEPVPGDPSKKLLKEAEKLSPDDRLELATGLRREAGEALGDIRDQLAKVKDTGVSAASLKDQFRGAFSDLPTEVQAKALEQLDGMVGSLSKGGVIQPAAVRKLIEDVEGLAKFGTPNLEAALGNARARVFQSARGVLVQNERELIAKALPERAEEYVEALRKYGVYSDFELGSKVILERANKGQKLIKQPTRDTEQGRNLLRLAVSEFGARAGALVPLPGATVAGARAGEGIVERWGRWLQPTVASTSAKLKKLERLQPMMEEALRKGPAEVARVHALFMQRSPDYRKAIQSEE